MTAIPTIVRSSYLQSTNVRSVDTRHTTTRSVQHSANIQGNLSDPRNRATSRDDSMRMSEPPDTPTSISTTRHRLKTTHHNNNTHCTIESAHKAPTAGATSRTNRCGSANLPPSPSSPSRPLPSLPLPSLPHALSVLCLSLTISPSCPPPSLSLSPSPLSASPSRPRPSLSLPHALSLSPSRPLPSLSLSPLCLSLPPPPSHSLVPPHNMESSVTDATAPPVSSRKPRCTRSSSDRSEVTK